MTKRAIVYRKNPKNFEDGLQRGKGEKGGGTRLRKRCWPAEGRGPQCKERLSKITLLGDGDGKGETRGKDQAY